ncbi:MAG: ABC transporter ATP-binding protein/permease [Chloroflexota bacterium]|nr:ABC transporter ATP-binding protein/permease [Chloroflexota bacterium]
MLSHLLQYKRFVAWFLFSAVMVNVFFSSIPRLTGLAFDEVLRPNPHSSRLLTIALVILAVVIISGLTDISARMSSEILGKRLARDARDELYVSLLGKSQTFHNRQRTGDVMARASNDVQQLSNMIVPGADLIFDSMTALVVPIIFIGILDPRLLLMPLLFTVGFLVTVRRYTRQLNPVTSDMRGQFGVLNAGLTETITGIEVVKAAAQEEQEKQKFEHNARRYRDLFVRNGLIQARYLPVLVLGITIAGAFLHGLFLLRRGDLSVGDFVAFMGLMALLRFPAFISIFTFNLVQLGIAGASRILDLMNEESTLDENEGGYSAPMRGEIVFENVSFSYGDKPVLRNISFRAEPGQTIAIVGQTGSGKSTLAKLVNRIYDVDEGRILIDGVDTRDWSLQSLRSQISTIEQDVFLFSRSIAENIEFGLGSRGTGPAIQQAARDAQAHDFIMHLPQGYETVIGERGVTLSGGQRQRLAIARALLTDPRILMLDDSTSAIDSATEDQIQGAIRRVLEGRTTLLITHRLSQIRWANKVLVLRQGELVDQGSHEELLERSEPYRRIFARYEQGQPVRV